MRRIKHLRSSRMIATGAGVLLLVAAASVTGCRLPADTRPASAMDTRADAHQPVDFMIEPSMQEIMTGEIVTLTARDRNTAGRNPTIEWNTTGGQLTTERNGRIARVQFDTPGVYTVTGRIFADDMVVSDTVEITVRAIR